MYDNIYDEITECLFLGSARSLESSDKFSMIINCTRNSDIPFPKNHRNCIRIPIDDDPSESAKMLSYIYDTQVMELMHNSIIKKEAVLVHCFAGMQRSCALVACYLMQYYNITPIEAIDYIKEKRPIAFWGNVNLLTTIEQFYFNLREK